MAERYEESDTGDVLSLGVVWHDPDISAAGRLMLAGLLIAFEYWRFDVVYPILGLVFRYPWRWDSSVTFVTSYLAYGLIGVTAWHWLRGGIQRALVFHRGGAVSTPYRLWNFSGDWPGTWYRIHAPHTQIVSVRARPAMSLTWGGEQSELYDVVALMSDGFVATVAVHLDKDEAHRIAELATQALTEIRALDVHPLAIRERLPAATLAAGLGRIVLGRYYRDYVEKDRAGTTLECGVVWWEGGVGKGLFGLAAWTFVVFVPSLFILAVIAPLFAQAAWWVPPCVYLSGALVMHLAVGRKMPECGFRGILRQLGFTRDGQMPAPFGFGMYDGNDAVPGDHDNILRIAAVPAARRWGVAFYGKSGNIIFVAVDLPKAAALEIAEGMRMALAGMRQEKQPFAGGTAKRSQPANLRYRRHLAQGLA